MAKKPAPYEFKKKCDQMLKLLGATPGGRYEMVLETIAGPLDCSANEDWLACKFEDIKLAKQLIGTGNLNPHSGKWNWMYTKPNADDMVTLFETMATVVDMSDDELAHDYAAALAALPEAVNVNTRLTYMYRDGDNYKTGRSVMFSGCIRDPERMNALLLALDASEGHRSLIPGSVGLDDLQDSFAGCESRWDPESDHPWHEVTSLMPVVASAEDGESSVLDERTIQEFAQQVVRQVIGSGWNEDHKPVFYPEMKKRFEQHQRASAKESA